MDSREHHLAYGDRAAILEELAHIAWGVGIHAEVMERYATIGHLEGLDLAAQQARHCLHRFSELRSAIEQEAGHASR